MIPIFALIAMVLGTIYMGIFLPSEAAACGVSGAFVLAAINNSGDLMLGGILRGAKLCGITGILPAQMKDKLEDMSQSRPFSIDAVKEAADYNGKLLSAAFLSTVRTSSMIMFILFVAFSMQTTFAFLGISRDMADWVSDLNLSPTQFVLLLVGFYLVLGTFMESYSMLFLTLPILLPPAFRAGVDPFSFGIVLIILVEMAQISPPQGLCLYILHSTRRDLAAEGKPGLGAGGSTGTIIDVYTGVLPFMACMMLVLGLLIAFPQIVYWLPDLVRGK